MNTKLWKTNKTPNSRHLFLMLVLISTVLCLIIDLFFSIFLGKHHMTHNLIRSIHPLIVTIHMKIRGALCSGTCALYLCCLFVLQGAAERSSLLLCAWCDWRAEQSTRPHHHAGAWLPSGPGHWPLPGTEEWGAPPPNLTHTNTQRFTALNSTPPTAQFTPVCCQDAACFESGQGDLPNTEQCHL